MSKVVAKENRRAPIGQELAKAFNDINFAPISMPIEQGITASLVSGNMEAYAAGLEALADLKAQF